MSVKSDPLRQIHPKPRKAILDYIVDDKNPKNLVHHQSIFEKLNELSFLKTFHEDAWKTWPFRNEFQRIVNASDIL